MNTRLNNDKFNETWISDLGIKILNKILYRDQSMDFILNQTIISRIVKITVILWEKWIFNLKPDKRFKIHMYQKF